MSTARFTSFSTEYLRLARQFKATSEYAARLELIHALRRLDQDFG
jgi:hypothetical protein